MPLDGNKKIAVNTLILYVRMFVIMGISLYTSRIVLAALGQDNYGIYNLIGGIVVLFSFITNSMTNSTQRFLNYYTGIGNLDKVTRVFSSSKLAHILISLIFIILSETIGLWFVETQLNIPPGRMIAARWVYQTSIISAIFGIIVIPFRAAIIAQEKMGIFAYISIIEVILKLIIAIILPTLTGDTLIIYSILFCSISILSYYGHLFTCRILFDFTRKKFIWDKQQFKEILTFSGWYLLGGVAMIGTKQGINILINIFYSVALNAAVGIANQVRTAVYSFVTNFQTAFNPQIVSLYAKGEYKNLNNLIYKSTKFSYYLLFIISVPIILYCDKILGFWLVNVPSYSVPFTQLVIITSFCEALSAPLWTAIGATGKVRNYQIFVSIILITEIPISFICLKLGLQPTSVFIANIFINILAYIYRVVYIKRYVHFQLKSYAKEIILPCGRISIISCLIVIAFDSVTIGSIPLVCNILIACIVTSLTIWIGGLSSNERSFIIGTFLKRFNH